MLGGQYVAHRGRWGTTLPDLKGETIEKYVIFLLLSVKNNVPFLPNNVCVHTIGTAETFSLLIELFL